MQPNSIDIWTVYKYPYEHPKHYVAVLFVVSEGIAKPAQTIYKADTLAGIRLLIPAYLSRIPRSKQDEFHIVESWI